MTVRSSRLRALPCLFLLLVATALLPQRLFASQEFLDLIIDTGDTIGGISLAGGDRDCTAQAFNEVKTALRKGRLSGGGDWVEGDEEVSLQGACPASKVDVVWFKRTNKLLVTARLGCDCTGKGPGDLERGSVQFIAPVAQKTQPDGSQSYDIGPIGDIKIEAACCLSRRGESLTVFSNTGARKTPTANAPTAQDPVTTPPAPTAAPQPTRPAPPPAPRPTPIAPPAAAGWSEQNPCPECEQEKQIVDEIAQRRAQLDLEVRTTQELLDANIRKRLQAEHRIDDIDTRLDDERGQGGESWDPHTGITVRSYDQGNGTVKVDTLGPNGELLDSYSYPRKSSQELIEERAAREAEVESLEQEEAALRERLDAAHEARSRAEADLEQARRDLRVCIATRCNPSSQSGGSGAPRPAVAVDADGSFTADVALEVGANEIRVPALDTADATHRIPVDATPTSTAAPTGAPAAMPVATPGGDLPPIVEDWRPSTSAAAPAEPTTTTADGNFSADVALEVGANDVAVTARDLVDRQPQDAVVREMVGDPAAQPIAPAPATTAGCDGSAINQPQDLGAVSDYESLKKDLESAAEGLAQKALGGLFGGGGGFSLGGGDMDIPDSAPTGPDTEKDPIDDDLKQTFTDPETGASIKVGMQLDGDKLLISTAIDELPGRGTLHSVVLEDGDCQVQKPDEQILYRVEQDWRLDLWWSHDRYVDGEHVLHEEGSSFETGTLDHGTVAVPTQGEAEASPGLAGVVPAWQQFGFASPLGGVRGMGSVFQFSERENRDLINFAVHVALQRGDRIRTVVFPMHVVLEALATRQLLAQMGYRFSLEKALEGVQPVSGDGGDSAQELDAPVESILDEIDEEIVIN